MHEKCNKYLQQSINNNLLMQTGLSIFTDSWIFIYKSNFHSTINTSEQKVTVKTFCYYLQLFYMDLWSGELEACILN